MAKRRKPKASKPNAQGVQKFGARFKAPTECRPNHPDVGCAAHGYAKCDFCKWISPNLRQELKPKTKCGSCGAASQGYRQCQKCTNLGRMPSLLFVEDADGVRINPEAQWH